jgi:succinate dehydrogenase/fumarate reductase cytochrome b subunit
VVPSTYRDLFTALASASGALTGLLFVALSVTSRPGAYSGPPVIHQVRAAAAWLAFTNVLMVSLFGLVPDTNAGYPAVVLGIIGITYTASAIRSVLASEATSRQQLRQSGLGVVLLLVFGTELGAGIALIAHPASASAAQAIGYALVSSLLVGVARSWELVGTRDPGIVASLTALTGRQHLLGDDADDPGRE